MDPDQLEFIIIKVLRKINLYSAEAVDLLMLTAAQESHCGKYIYQLGRGPARGIFQMEPRTLDDLYFNFLSFRRDLAEKLDMFRASYPELDLEANIAFQIVAARLYYYRFPAIIPKWEWFKAEAYINALAQYWKKYWNTYAGAGSVKEAVNNYNLYVKRKNNL
jgi:hypothetical protein